MSATEKQFENTGAEFSGHRAAEAWLLERGFVTGSMQSGAPMGIMPAEHYRYVAKWRNLSPNEKKGLSGTLQAVAGSPRTDAMVIRANEGTSLANVLRRAAADDDETADYPAELAEIREKR